jgi:signal transduction histidine kinase
MADILEVSHIEQGRTDFTPEIIDPAAAIKEIMAGIAPKAEAKGLQLFFDGQDFKHQIRANKVCFNRIITNLLENAVKYTPKGKVAVSIVAQTAKKRVMILVQDTGFGISAEGQAHLFGQFYRVKTAANAGIPGTGLGLWMSREMARKMGGDILLESIENMGSRFFVYFPLV